ncbi:Uncharacterised protein [Dermatophilus congolensis]|uniref:Uncharacterized protein n=1 Tax=Dermatophilus congolensis TaxID=1863 RepID=A0AA46H1A9_9MICO|nr:hypothetical protein [Dermatophilus congolensis]STD14221.1 Uncharacterised protein [Dermatophilus congolensis]
MELINPKDDLHEVNSEIKKIHTSDAFFLFSIVITTHGPTALNTLIEHSNNITLLRGWDALFAYPTLKFLNLPAEQSSLTVSISLLIAGTGLLYKQKETVKNKSPREEHAEGTAREVTLDRVCPLWLYVAATLSCLSIRIPDKESLMVFILPLISTILHCFLLAIQEQSEETKNIRRLTEEARLKNLKEAYKTYSTYTPDRANLTLLIPFRKRVLIYIKNSPWLALLAVFIISTMIPFAPVFQIPKEKSLALLIILIFLMIFLVFAVDSAVDSIINRAKNGKTGLVHFFFLLHILMILSFLLQVVVILPYFPDTIIPGMVSVVIPFLALCFFLRSDKFLTLIGLYLHRNIQLAELPSGTESKNQIENPT